MKFLVATVVLFFATLVDTGVVMAHSLASFQNRLAEKEPYYTAIDLKTPGFELADVDGNIFTNESLHGKVVILYFICTQCVDLTYKQGRMIASLQDMINISAMRDMVKFVGIIRGNDENTGEFVKNYREKHDLDSINLILLTGDDGQLSDTGQLALQFTYREQGVVFGQEIVTHIIGMEGRWSGFFTGVDFNATNLVILVNALTNVNSAENNRHDDDYGDEADYGTEAATASGFWGGIFGRFD